MIEDEFKVFFNIQDFLSTIYLFLRDGLYFSISKLPYTPANFSIPRDKIILKIKINFLESFTIHHNE